MPPCLHSAQCCHGIKLLLLLCMVCVNGATAFVALPAFAGSVYEGCICSSLPQSLCVCVCACVRACVCMLVSGRMIIDHVCVRL